jgi:hypothetical protein
MSIALDSFFKHFLRLYGLFGLFNVTGYSAKLQYMQQPTTNSQQPWEWLYEASYCESISC